MTPRSVRHHQVPKWLLKHFSWKKRNSNMLWVGFKDTREIKQANVDNTFFRNNANTRTDYHSQDGGNVQPTKSDRDEKILRDFDNQAAPAVRRLIGFSRKWRDAGPVSPLLSPVDLEIYKQLVVVQARRTRESQDRMGMGEDKSALYLELFFRIAEEHGQQPPSKQDLLEDPRVTARFDTLSQNHRATFASANHPILADKEVEFLAPLGLRVAAIYPAASEFIIGSHGVTIIETPHGGDTWLPIAPDVAVSFYESPGIINIGIYPDEFVQQHNLAAFSASAQVAGQSKGTIQGLLNFKDFGLLDEAFR